MEAFLTDFRMGMAAASTGRAVFADHPLQQRFQDIQVAMAHAFLGSNPLAKALGGYLLRTGTAPERVLFDVTGTRDSGGASFGTDGEWFSGFGIVSLICGPGDLDQAHQPDEFIRREPFESGSALVSKVIERMCCGARPA